MRKITIFILTLIMSVGTIGTANAQGIPVYDNTSFINQLREIVNQGVSLGNEAQSLANDVTDLQNGVDQLFNLEAQLTALTGTRNAGDLFNSLFEQEMRRAIPQTFNELISGGGSSGASQYVQDINDIYQPPATSLLFDDVDSSRAIRYERRRDITIGNMAASQSAYDTSGERVATLEAMLDELNTTDDIKASIDVQSRIMIENTIVLNELLRLQALALQSDADIRSRDLEIRKYDAEFMEVDLDAMAAQMTSPQN